jgi:hypothetical protein
MIRTFHLVNNRHGIVDLSPLADVEGKRLILQPKDFKDSAREVRAEVIEHPHVQRFLSASWLLKKDVELSPPPPAEEPAPAEASEPVQASEAVPPLAASPAISDQAAADPQPETNSGADVETTQAPSEVAPSIPANPTPETIAPVADSVMSPATQEGRKKRR